MSLELTRETDGEYCTGCGSRLIWGKFAYNQELCWDCFEQQVNYIASKITTPQDREMVMYLLKTTEHAHGTRNKYIKEDF